MHSSRYDVGGGVKDSGYPGPHARVPAPAPARGVFMRSRVQTPKRRVCGPS